MNSFSSLWLNWIIAELVITAIAFAIYHVLKAFKRSSSDSFLFLKASFLAAPFLPLIPFPYAGRAWIEVGSNSTIAIQTNNAIVHSQNIPIDLLVKGSFALYAMIAVCGLIRVLISVFKLHIFAKEGIPEKRATHNFLLHPLDIPPATIGHFRPKILLSRSVYEALDAQQFEMVMRHENVHIERRDYVFNLVRAVVQSVLFFSPFVHFMSRYFQREMEISCDELAIAGGGFSAREYGHLLLDLITRAKTRHDLVYSGLFASNSLITMRIKAMKQKTSLSNPLVTYGFVVLTLTLGYFGSVALGVTPTVATTDGRLLDKSSEFALLVEAKMDTPNGIGAVGANVKLNLSYGKTGAIELGEKKLTITLTKNEDSSINVIIGAYDQDGNLIHKSNVPFDREASIKAKLDPSTSGGVFSIGVTVKRT
jgi:hypothetical protein